MLRMYRLKKLFSHLRIERCGGWHWFDHPEMQERIAQAEADRREGRVKKFETRDMALGYLGALGVQNDIHPLPPPTK